MGNPVDADALHRELAKKLEVSEGEGALRILAALQLLLAQGHVPSFLTMARALMEGRIGPPNAAAAVALLLDVHGVAEARYLVERAVPQLEAEARAGSADAQCSRGLVEAEVHGRPQAAIPWYEMAVRADHPAAMRLLGHACANGIGIDVDQARAAALFRRSAEGGDGWAMLNYDMFLRRGLGGLERDLDGALRWMRPATRAGITVAQRVAAETLAERDRDLDDAAEAIERLVLFANAVADSAERGDLAIRGRRGEWSFSIRLGTVGGGLISGLDGVRAADVPGLGAFLQELSSGGSPAVRESD